MSNAVSEDFEAAARSFEEIGSLVWSSAKTRRDMFAAARAMRFLSERYRDIPDEPYADGGEAVIAAANFSGD